MRVHSLEKINQLKQLREKGYSIQELTRLLLMPKTTVWHHVQGVKIRPQYIKILKSKQGGSKTKSLNEWQKARAQALELLSNLTKREKLLIAVALYWGEGSKGDFSLSNTDPKLIKAFIHCLQHFGINKDDLSVNIRIFEDIDKEKAIRFWSGVTGLSRKQIKYVDVLHGKKKGKLMYGMCRLRVIKGGFWLKLIQAMKDVITQQITPS